MATVTVGGAGTDNASAANKTYTVAAPTADYTYTISGFGTGDTLVFPAGASITINNLSGADGILDLVAPLNGHVATIRLTEIPAASDGAVFNANSFKTTFGPTSLQP